MSHSPSAGAPGKVQHYTFADRWRIRGTFTTRSPMHVGSGETTERPGLTNEGAVRPCEVQAVTLDWQGRPCIPGSALKGVLRSWASTFLRRHADAIRRLFGDPDVGSEVAEGGRAEFLTAFVVRPKLPKGWPGCIPYPDACRMTGVMASISIDRASRVAMPDHLFYEEYVPPGVVFQVEILATGVSDGDVTFLLALLEKGAAHPTHPLQFGANGNSEWGRVAWALEEVTRIPEGQISLQSIAMPCFPWNCELDENISAADLSLDLSPQLILDLALEFHGPYLVNDPFRTKSKEGGASDAPPDHAPLRTHDGGFHTQLL